MSSRIRRTAVASATIALALVASSHAQEATTTVVAPPMECQKPGDFAPVDRQSAEATRFAKRLEEYKNCVMAYSKANGAKSNELAAQSRVYADAANKAIDEYNELVVKLNEKSKADAGAKK